MRFERAVTGELIASRLETGILIPSDYVNRRTALNQQAVETFLPFNCTGLYKMVDLSPSITLQDLKQDEVMIREVAKVQAPYNRFRKQLQGSAWNGICETVTIDHGGHLIQVNLYNTALLSQNPEHQGQLHVPLKTFEQHTSFHSSVALAISVFHHSYLWLESDTSISFRRHIESTSDIALMGHQHYGHEFYKQNSTGERVLYIETRSG